MVGHINGEAVYADQIFDVNLQAQLETFGRRYNDDQFLERAAPVIEERLRGIIINKLILGEAERNLGETQRRGIDQRVEAERDELMRFYGQGSIAMAKAKFREDRGIEFDDHLASYREELSIRFFLQAQVMPKIVVNQRDVERWFEDHKNQFVQPDRRVIRLIRVAGDTEAIQRRLSRGETFEDVASDPGVNSYNPSGTGLFNGGDPLAGDIVIGIEPVNNALLGLAEGEHAGPIDVADRQYFVQVVSYEPGVTVELRDAQIQIEQRLRSEQFERHALRFRMDLFERGSFTDPMQMSEKLLEIAYARYDR